MNLTKLETEILNHRLEMAEEIAEALDRHFQEDVQDVRTVAALLMAGDFDTCLANAPELTADILQDAVDGSTYLGHANHMSRQAESAARRAGESLAEKVGAFIGRNVEFAGY